MKAPLVLGFSFLITAVWAGGYQNCLERVWLFESFLIDQHNPAADRQIGYKCNNWSRGSCVGSWIACNPREGRTQCNFDDFQRFMGNHRPGTRNQQRLRPDGSLDNKQTAYECIWAWRDMGSTPFNFRGYNAVRHGRANHNDFIYRIGQINNDNYNKPSVRAAAGDAAFKNADDTLNRISTARVADHGRHLITQARNGLNGVTVVEKDMGPNPYYKPEWAAPPGVLPDEPSWRTVDWEATINNSPNPANTRTQVRNWLDSFYRGPTPNRSARDHWQVLRSVKTVKDRTNRCRKH